MNWAVSTVVGDSKGFSSVHRPAVSKYLLPHFLPSSSAATQLSPNEFWFETDLSMLYVFLHKDAQPHLIPTKFEKHIYLNYSILASAVYTSLVLPVIYSNGYVAKHVPAMLHKQPFWLSKISCDRLKWLYKLIMGEVISFVEKPARSLAHIVMGAQRVIWYSRKARDYIKLALSVSAGAYKPYLSLWQSQRVNSTTTKVIW